MKKQLLFIILTLLPLLAMADSSGKCGANVTYTYSESSKTLRITGSGAMTNYEKAIYTPWYSYCKEIKTVVIAPFVTSIGSGAFEYCSSLTSVTIGNYVTSIGDNAFSYCSALISITIPNSVNKIGKFVFSKCSGLTSITISSGVPYIGECMFFYCTGLTSITIPNSVTSIGYSAFEGCSGLTSITIPSNVSSVGRNAFQNCFGLTSVRISNGVKIIGDQAFEDCSGLTSVTIPNSVTSIGISPFSGCSDLTSIIVENGNEKYDSRENCNAIIETESNKLIQGCKTTTIPNSVRDIGEQAFRNCSGLSSVSIPNSVKIMGNRAFEGCSSLTSVIIPNSVTSIGISPFSGCSDLTSIIVENGNEKYDSRDNCNAIIETESNKLIQGCKTTTIHNSVTSIGNSAFEGCSGLTSITIPSNVSSVGSNAFDKCLNLTYITLNSNSVVSTNRTLYSSLNTVFGNQVTNLVIGNDVTSIGDYAFYNCTNIKTIILPNNVVSIGQYAFYSSSQASVIIGDNIASIPWNSFDSKTQFFTKHKTKTLFALWNDNKKYIYEQETSKSLAPPSLSSNSRTQTSFNVVINNMYDDYIYEFNGETITNSTIGFNYLYPGYYGNYTLTVRYNDLSYTYNGSIGTQSLSPSVKATSKTASSLSINGKYTKGNAEITKTTISLNGKTIEGENISVTGLNPNTSYKVIYTITIKYGENLEYTRDYTASSDIKTDALTLTTQQPKVISLGNVIVAAESNVDDAEKNVGFEWRRTDWTSDFASNTGTAYLFEGTMEGYIRNLNTDKLWKFRPYYLADNGTYYYGDWIGLDPTNISYFEPTVHTYSQIGVKGNTALIKGYALGGSDDITVQGFKYWKNAGSGSNRVSSTDIPGTANTVEASGTIMEVSLSNLDYESSYSYVAFATTSKGTYYGEIKTFDTDSDPTGINGIKVDNATTASVHEIARYNMHGRRITTAEKGINIIRMSDGTSRKVVVK